MTRGIVAEIERTGGRPVYLDMTHLDRTYVQSRFPTIYTTCPSVRTGYHSLARPPSTPPALCDGRHRDGRARPDLPAWCLRGRGVGLHGRVPRSQPAGEQLAARRPGIRGSCRSDGHGRNRNAPARATRSRPTPRLRRPGGGERSEAPDRCGHVGGRGHHPGRGRHFEGPAGTGRDSNAPRRRLSPPPRPGNLQHGPPRRRHRRLRGLPRRSRGGHFPAETSQDRRRPVAASHTRLVSGPEGIRFLEDRP